jgi:hypothetical protein
MLVLTALLTMFGTVLLPDYTPAAAVQDSGRFIPTGNMTVPRIAHTATLLLNGKVLITGGWDPTRQGVQVGLASAELFDPGTGTFTQTGNMTVPRIFHTATLLPDGRVFIAGGGRSGASLNIPELTAEVYDPSTGAFTETGRMITAQFAHSATLLNNETILISAGRRYLSSDFCEDFGADPELYDPITATFTATGDYADKNYCLGGAPVTLLPNGKVLVAVQSTAELYDPDTGAFSLTGQNLGAAGLRTSTLLRNGKVLLTGGADYLGYYANAQVYDPSTGTFTATGNMTRPRSQHTATLLGDGTVLIAGSQLSPGVTASAELYDPATGTFTATADMTSPRFWHTATLLMDGRILLAGGYTSYAASPTSYSAELYVPSVLVPAPIVKRFRFDRSAVVAGSSYSVDVSGSNLTSETFFDVRFTSPGSKEPAVVANWQRGLAASHDVVAGTALGPWTINGVRPHEIETDHTGSFIPVKATITVSP